MFYGSPPQTFLYNEITGFETGSRPYILKYGAPCHPPRRHRSIVLCTQEDVMKGICFVASFVVLISREVFIEIEGNCSFFGGAISYYVGGR